MKKISLIISTLLITSAFAGDSKWGVSVNTNTQYEGKGNEAKGNAEVFIPIHQNNDRITFVDLRGQLSSADSNKNISIALGHRKNFDDKFIVGLNASYDSALSANDNRFGQVAAGIELLTKKTDIKVNFYKAIDGRHEFEGTSVAPYAALEGNEIRVLSRTADYEAGMDGADIRVGHRFDLDNDLTVTLSGTGYYYKGEGTIEDLYGAEAKAELAKAFDFFGLDASIAGYIGADHNNWNGTQFIAGAGFTAKFGKRGQDRINNSYLDGLMDSFIDRESSPLIGLGEGEWSNQQGTGTLAGYDFSYIDTIIAGDDVQGTIDGSSSNTLLVLSGEKGAITITENVNLGSDRIMIGSGRPILVTGPNGEKAILILPENRATVNGQSSNIILMGSGSYLDGLDMTGSAIRVIDANNVTVNDVNMTGGVESTYQYDVTHELKSGEMETSTREMSGISSISVEDSTNVHLTNITTNIDPNSSIPLDVLIIDSDGIVLSNSAITSNGLGVGVFGSENVLISDNTISAYYGGIGMFENDNVIIKDNTIDSIESAIIHEGHGTVQIEGNTISTTKTGIDIQSSGDAIVDGNTITGSETAIEVSDSNSATISGNNVAASSTGINVNGTESVTINGNNVNAQGNGINIYSSDSSTVIYNDVDSQQTGIYIFDSESATVSDNDVNSQGDGISIYASDNSTVSDNKLESESNGIFIVDSDNSTISDNDVSSQEHGINVLGSNDAIVSGNDVISQDRGTNILGSNGVNVSDNNIISQSEGIYINGSASSIISGNTVESQVVGIYILNSVNTTISGNDVNSQFYGIYATDSENATVSDNVVKAQEVGVHIYQADNSTISGNDLNTEGYGIIVQESNSTTVTNNATESQWVGVYTYESDLITVSGNDINSRGYGIYVDGSDNSKVSGNDVNSKSTGIELVSVGGNITIEKNALTHTIDETLTENSKAIKMYNWSSDIRVGNFVITGNTIDGFDVGVYSETVSTESTYTISGNTLRNIKQTIIKLSGGDSASIMGNIVEGTSDQGIYLTNISLTEFTPAEGENISGTSPSKGDIIILHLDTGDWKYENE